MASMMSGVQGAVAEEVNDRLEKATADLVNKYAAGKGGNDASVDGPTGAAYKEKQLAEQRAKKAAKENKQQQSHEEAGARTNGEHHDGEDDQEGGDDDDYELRKIKEQRLREIKNAQREKLENLGKGHGQYREITQDEFLAEVTSSTRVVCHFYHAEFPRCAVIDHHIQRLVQRHIETKFIKINAEKAPFFVSKLAIRSLPTIIIFFDGIAADKIIGFEGLADKMPEGKEDEWPTITLARLLGQKNAISKEAIVDDDDVELQMKAKMEDLRRKQFVGMQASALDEDGDDFDLDNV